MALLADLSEGESDIERGGVIVERLSCATEAAVLGSAGAGAVADDGAVWPAGAVGESVDAEAGFAGEELSFSAVIC